MSHLIEAAIHNARVMYMLLVLIFIAGIYSYIAIPKESDPDIPLPLVYVSLHQEGISPEDAVDLLIKPMEQELRGLDGLDEIEATAYEGGANIIVKFIAGSDSDKSINDVRNKVDIAKSELPAEADEPTVTEINISTFPILTIILRGDIPERQMKTLADDLADALEGVSGVLEAKVRGTREEQVVVEIDRKLIATYNLQPAQIIQAFQNNNQLVAAGILQMEDGRYAIKAPGLFETRREMMEQPIFSEGDKVIRVKDIARVLPGFKDAEFITRVNGEQAVSIEISKRIGENIIETVDAVKAVMKAAEPLLPQGVTYTFISDKSEQTRTQLNDLQNSVLTAVFLVMLVILVALGVRSALLVAIAIPGSFLLAMIVLFTSGFTTNVVVLFGLILSVGMLVDGAIVVTELADTKLREGAGRREAFGYAAKYMAWPIIASTATTLAAFMPLLFWPGIVGEFMKYLPITLIFTLCASLIMALLFLPMIGATSRKRPQAFVNAGGAAFAERYGNLLEKVLRRPLRVLGFTLLGFIGSIMLYANFGNGVEFFPDIEPEQGSIKIFSRGDYSINQKDDIMQQVASRLQKLDGVETLYVTTGFEQSTAGPGDQIGSALLVLEDFEDRAHPAKVIFADALARLNDIPGISAEKELEQAGPGQGKPVKIYIQGHNVRALPDVVHMVQEELTNVPGTVDINNSLPVPGIEWNLNINRTEVAKAQSDITTIGSIIRLVTSGLIIGTYRPDDKNDELDITARLQPHQRTLETLDDMSIVTPAGRVPLSNFIERTPQQKVTTISRIDQKNAYFVDADVAEGTLANDVVLHMKDWAARQQLPMGTEIVFKGEDEDQAEAMQFLMKAFFVAIFIMAIILVAQFNSFYQAGVILSAVVLSTTGVFLGHLLTGKPFGIVMSGLGVIALAGIVVNNNIVLIDTFNKLKTEMNDWRAALIETGKSRLRPVVLTATTTIIGLMPLALRLNVDVTGRVIEYNTPSTQWWDQLANTIAFGLAFATILTLIITPCMIAVAEQWKERRQH